MSKKQRNQPIGTCPCPAKSCEEMAPVFKFKGRENVLQRRLAGKVYLQCPVHGRFGADGAQGAIDYIMGNIVWPAKSQSAGAAPEKLDQDSTRESSVEGTPAPAVRPAPEEPKSPAPKRSRDLWDW